MFPRNFWYVAGWDWEVRRQELFRRVICGEPLVFWRQEDGTPAVLEDRCCHRHMPLSEGKLKGSNVECSYHGLVYDASGACVKVPSQKAIPPSARVRSYPVVERYHWVWVWMGDPALADPALIEDFHWMDDPAWRFKGERLDLKGNYMLIVENLLDLTHLQFVHPTTLGTDSIAGAPIKAERDGNRVRVTRWMMESPPPPFFQRVGGNRSQGMSMRNLNAVTPETETTSHYFWAQPHDFRLDDPTVTELIFRQVHTAFLEDLAVIEAQQNNLDIYGERLPEQVDFNQDAGGIQPRRIIAAILAAENDGAPARRRA
jgi:phenylpropionate dioxygenase-like ring-hydroxylating dioxygenase large terminal subunit